MQGKEIRERGWNGWLKDIALLTASWFIGGIGGTAIGIVLSLSYLSRRSASNGMPILESEHILFAAVLALLGGVAMGQLLKPKEGTDLPWFLLCATTNPIALLLFASQFTGEPEARPFPGTASLPAFDRVVVDGGSAYLLSPSSTGYRLDVRDPRNPRVEGESFGANRPGGLSSAARDLKIVDGRGYIAAEGQGLVVLDLRDPARPALLGESGANGLALKGTRVSVDGGLAALAGADGVALLDVRDPARIALVAQTNNERWQEFRDVALAGGWVYLLHQDGLAIIEHTASGTLEQRIDLPFSDSREVQIIGRRAYVFAYSRLHRLEISDPSRPTELTPITHAGEIAAATVDGTRAYLLNSGQHLLTVVDLADSDLPVVLAEYHLPYQSSRFGGDGPNLAVRDGIVYLNTSERSLALLDLRNGQPKDWAACVIYTRFWPKCAHEPLSKLTSTP